MGAISGDLGGLDAFVQSIALENCGLRVNELADRIDFSGIL